MMFKMTDLNSDGYIDKKTRELKNLQATSKEDLWKTDLNKFIEKLDEVEAKEAQEDAADASSQEAAGKGGKKGGKKKTALKKEALPSDVGIRVVPKIADELKTKYAKAAAAKERKANKAEGKGKVKEEKDEFDALAEGEDAKKGGRLKQTKLDLKPKVEVEAKPKKNPWSDSADSDDDRDLSAPPVPREKVGRKAAEKQSYNLDESSDPDDISGNEGIMSVSSENESEDQFVVSDADSDDNGSSLAKKIASKPATTKPAPVSKPKSKQAPAKKLNKADDLVDVKLPAKKSQEPKQPVKKTVAQKKKVISQSSDVDEKPAPKKSKNVLQSSDSEFDVDDVHPNPRAASGRAKSKKYTFAESSDSDF